jgi:hypothetical protein
MQLIAVPKLPVVITQITPQEGRSQSLETGSKAGRGFQNARCKMAIGTQSA